MTRKKKRTKSPDLKGPVLINGKAIFYCKNKARRAALIQELRETGKLKEDYQLREV